MKGKRKKKNAPAEMVMMLAEDARTINAYGSTLPSGQQIFMENLSHTRSKEAERRIVEELTK